MVIIFYDADKESVYICSDREKMKEIPVSDLSLMSHVPNDDILYVQNASFITKQQFGDWLAGSGSNSEPNRFTGFLDEDEHSYDQSAQNMVQTAAKYANSKWLHPTRNGAILIPDLKSEKYPEGVEMIGKYHFVSVEDVGGFDALEESLFYKSLLAKGKIEVVGYEYVKKHQGKKQVQSAADAALDAILVKDGSAVDVAAAGGIDQGAIEFFVE